MDQITVPEPDRRWSSH